MFGSNQSLPDSLSLQLLTRLHLPQAATSRPLLPQLPFSSRSPILLTASSCDDTVCEPVLLIIYSQKRLPVTYSCIFFLFPSVVPTPIYPQTLTPCSGSILGMACSEHCGVLRTAWSNVDVAWVSPVRGLHPELLSDVSRSAQRFSAFNLRILAYTVHFLCVATHERGPGGMTQITAVEAWD